jgi:hypothetical protein
LLRRLRTFGSTAVQFTAKTLCAIFEIYGKVVDKTMEKEINLLKDIQAKFYENNNL